MAEIPIDEALTAAREAYNVFRKLERLYLVFEAIPQAQILVREADQRRAQIEQDITALTAKRQAFVETAMKEKQQLEQDATVQQQQLRGEHQRLLDTMQRELAEMGLKREQIGAALQAAQGDHDARLQTLRLEHAQLEQTVKEARAQAAESIREAQAETAARAQTIRTSLGGIQSQLEAEGQRLSALQAQRTQLEQEVHALQRQKADREALAKQIQTLQSQLGDMVR